MDNDVIVCNFCHVETAIILVQFAQDADARAARRMSSFGF